MTPRQFRAWLRTLGVPALELKGGRYVEHSTFAIALLAAFHCTEGLMTTPGSASRSSRPTPPPPKITRDLAAVVISQLMLTSHTSEKLSREEILRRSKTAVKRLALAGYTPKNNKERELVLVRKFAERDPVVKQLLEALNDDPPHTTPNRSNDAAR